MAVNMKTTVFWEKSRDSSVGSVTGYRVDGKGATPSRSKRLFSTASRSALGTTQPPLQ
jgi:hypothetical protein